MYDHYLFQAVNLVPLTQLFQVLTFGSANPVHRFAHFPDSGAKEAINFIISFFFLPFTNPLLYNLESIIINTQSF